MNNRIDPILLRRKNILTIPKDGGHVADSTSKAMTASIIKNAEALGYTFSKDTINTLLTYSAQDLTDFYHDLIPALRRLKGADKTYQPMYPNFPAQVMEASSAELFINAIVHYLTCGEVLPELNKSICNDVVRICNEALRFNYAKREPLGKIYIDPEMKNFIVPFSQRSASKTLKTITRGSHIPLNETTNVVRAFIWWTNRDDMNYERTWSSGSRVDIDLSAAAYDENWKFVDHVSYTNLRSDRIRTYHSGDITNGGPVNGKGVAEFLDVDISSAVKNARYIVFQVYNYTEDNFCDLPNCRFGWMERMDMNSGEIFEPSTVEMAMDLTAQSNQAIPVVFDCVKREFIWCDLNGNVGSTSRGGNNLESNLNKTTAACYAMVNMEKPTLYDLILLNAQARGNVVNDRFDADIIFSNDQTREEEFFAEPVNGGERIMFKRETDAKIVTAYDADYFMAQLL